jgi:hypothetical protein
MKKEFVHKLCWLGIFAIAMGFLETAVVVYMRELYYPEGFAFPIKVIPGHIALTELLREAATLIMLFGAGMAAGKKSSERFAYFIYTFAVWDIFYYIFLKLLLTWPESLMTWDLLFLIPVPWIGPVLAPVILSVTMIIFTLLIIRANNFSEQVRIKRREWFLLFIGSLVIILSFTNDYAHYILNHYSWCEIWSGRYNDALFTLSQSYIPPSFRWWIFIAGEILIIAAIYLFWKRNRRAKKGKR